MREDWHRYHHDKFSLNLNNPRDTQTHNFFFYSFSLTWKEKTKSSSNGLRCETLIHIDFSLKYSYFLSPPPLRLSMYNKMFCVSKSNKTCSLMIPYAEDHSINDWYYHKSLDFRNSLVDLDETQLLLKTIVKNFQRCH